MVFCFALHPLTSTHRACNELKTCFVQASESYKANLLKSKTAELDSSVGVETHTDGVTSLMVAAVGGHMVSYYE